MKLPTQRRKNPRRWVPALLLCASMAGGWGLWRWWPHGNLLLDRATRVAPHWDENYSWNNVGTLIDTASVWISDYEIDRVFIAGPTSGYHDAHIDVFDVRTGNTKTVPVKQCPYHTHAYMVPSPDGRWALCCGGAHPITAVDLQTGRSISWPAAGDWYHYTNLWMGDCRRWLQVTALEDGYLTIHNVDRPKQSVRLPFPNSNAERWKEMVVTTSDHLLTVDSQYYTGQPQSQLTGLEIHEYRLLPNVVQLRSLHVSASSGVTMHGAAITPDGNQILWVRSQTYTAPFAVWLHRWIKSFPADPQRRIGLWSSRLDGSQMHEIGHLALRADDPVPSFDLHWLPGGKRVSFVYKSALYTVSAE